MRAHGVTCTTVQADVADRHAVDALFDAAPGPITGLVNNAGIIGPTGRLTEIDVDELPRVFAVDVVGVLFCCRRAAQVMAPGGAIVNLSSGAATLGAPGEYVHYAAAKAAVDTITIGLAKELGPDGIRVNAVAPGVDLDRDPRRPGAPREGRAADPARPRRPARRGRRRGRVAAQRRRVLHVGRDPPSRRRVVKGHAGAPPEGGTPALGCRLRVSWSTA